MSKIKGADFSKWQGSPDWNKVNISGLGFLILRSSYRKSVDPKFYEYVKKSKIPILGCYHFMYSINEEEAKEEARLAVQTAQKAGLSPEKIVIFADLEYDSIKDAAKKGKVIGPKECNDLTEAFCSEVVTLGYRAGIYCNKDYYRNMYDKELLSKYVLWLADYHDSDPEYPCTFHQYTSSGSVLGISGNVDLNYYYSNDFIFPVPETLPLNQIIFEIYDGKWGNGEARKNRLTAAGYDYEEIRNEINVIEQVCSEVLAGKWGNGEDRKNKLTAAGYDYELIRQRVNAYMRGH